ncbi:2-amino-4-hydroxy-6-hydroxymethyldihydropteridine diphosphokinase [Candidatus Tachikawaea gelatinosa]|uniref:2-amino-4-hydroxy-6-hydroxymethyldihydropteridine pyrophosphokinase n=1 Tax=Candidatus Tachikawaea gelatinosa TaxID=1410383 RepID=A0A090ALT7_9ENTR|nr:2-amino-4-hydroxy-6-hydroxymethyldihydropteridine diphosphokinase [Candidatus Tachikawaea gelatinosa]BAP58619.1 2-amino-4-hydroxy-6-hydroxymethyldihydropteridine pyrophosphokinase [Candidatus Tachikawaea gelatinosa]
MTYTYIALGSNLNNPLQQIKKAIKSIDQISLTKRIKTSSFYQTKPYGFLNQPDYINAVVLLKTEINVYHFMQKIQTIELKQGRVRNLSNKWHSRIIDIDILLFGDLKICTSYLTIPHYDIYNRNFFLIPLYEITSNLVFPDGNKLSEILKKTSTNDIKII